MINKITNKLLLEYLINGIVFFIIAYVLADFITVYYDYNLEKFIYLDERRIILEQNLLRLIGGVTGILILLLIIKNFHNYKPSKVFILFICSFFISYFIYGEGIVRPMLFYGMLLSFFFYEFYNNELFTKEDFSSLWVKKFVLIFVCFLFIPLGVFCLYYIYSGEIYFEISFGPQLYVVDSFRGLTLDRIQYSYLVGILFLVTYFEREIINKYYKLIMFICFIALLLSMSRAVVLALFTSILYYKFNSLKSFLKIVLYLLGIIILIWIFSPRMEVFNDGGNRIQIFIDGILYIFNNGIYSFLFGSGNFYTTYNNGIYPHNLLLQSIMDFGLIVTFFWIFLLYKFYKELNKKAKAMYLFVLVFGCFHPNFSVLVFVPFTVFSYVVILFVNRRV